MKKREILLTCLTIWFFTLLSISGCSSTKPGGNFSKHIAFIEDSLAKVEALDFYLTGSIHEEAGEIIQAALKYQLAHLYDPKSAEIILSLAKVYMKIGELGAALKALEAGWEQTPDNEELTIALLQHYLLSGALNRANALFKKLKSTRSLTESELMQQASVFRKMKRFDDALRVYDDYLKRYGPDPNVYDKIAQIHIVLENYNAAETTLKKIIELDSSNHFVYFVLGKFAVEREEWKEAETFFRQAVELDSTDTRYWANLMLVLNTQRKHQALLEVTDQAIDILPKEAPFYDIRADALDKLKRPRKALIALENAVALDSTRISSYLKMGYIYHGLKEWENSANAYESALKIEPENALVLNNYAYMLSEASYRLNEALEMVDKALEAEPENPSFIDTRGWIFYRLDKYNEALEQIERAMKLEDANAELYEHLGYIFEAIGEEEKAKSAWKRAYQIEPDNEEYKRLAE